MKCNRCKEEIDQVWALASHGRAYCSETCFYGRKDDASINPRAFETPPDESEAVLSGFVSMEIPKGH